MTARLRKALDTILETFWILPGGMVLLGIVAAGLMIRLDRSKLISERLLDSEYLYNGGATGARTLLGAVASSSIGVAGTIFSITIAALSLAAGQMGPRLLRNFVSDRGNQFTLGAFLGTFSYALVVLRSVRTPEEGDFVPHASLSVAILLAFLCVGTLVYFVGHMAGRINVDTVIDLVSEDIGRAMQRLTVDEPGPVPPEDDFWERASPVTDARSGYLQHIDTTGLATWARENGTTIRLLARPGHYVFPGAPIALLTQPVTAASAAIVDATAIGAQQSGSADLEVAVGQLVEVAVRALSPGINDPNTAIGVLDRLGAALCTLARLHLGTGVHNSEGRLALVVPVVDYDGLTDRMFHMIRQNAGASPAVLIRLLDVLTVVASCEDSHARIAALRRHAGLVFDDAKRTIANVTDRREVEERYAKFRAAALGGKAERSA